MATEEELNRKPSVSWVGLDEEPALYANMYLLQPSEHGEYVISFGEFIPPVLLGTDEQRAEQLMRVPFIPIRTVTRVMLTEPRALELAQLLLKMVEQQRAARESER